MHPQETHRAPAHHCPNLLPPDPLGALTPYPANNTSGPFRNGGQQRRETCPGVPALAPLALSDFLFGKNQSISCIKNDRSPRGRLFGSEFVSNLSPIAEHDEEGAESQGSYSPGHELVLGEDLVPMGLVTFASECSSPDSSTENVGQAADEIIFPKLFNPPESSYMGTVPLGEHLENYVQILGHQYPRIDPAEIRPLIQNGLAATRPKLRTPKQDVSDQIKCTKSYKNMRERNNRSAAAHRARQSKERCERQRHNLDVFAKNGRLRSEVCFLELQLQELLRERKGRSH